MKKYVVVLAGGSGERFWPLSTPNRPKQFLKIFGGKSLIRQAVERVLPLVPAENILVVTAQALARATYAELPELPRANILLEPCRKNTAPAIGSALGEILKRAGDGALAAVVTADQLIVRTGEFRKRLNEAYRLASRRDAIVTLGVKPTFASTGFGYIDAKRKVFVEKPDAATAARYVKSGAYVWNAGMFIFRAGALLEICRAVAPELAELAGKVKRARAANACLRRAYPTLTSISFDYAVMEKTRAIEVVSGDFGWDDVGSYATLAGHLPEDAAGNIRVGNVRALDCTGCSFLGTGARISAYGLTDVVIATCGNEILALPKSRAADLKKFLTGAS